MTVKETLTNIVNHANATEVWLRLRLGVDAICFIIEDNGRGFDTVNGAAISPGASGLGNMRQRFKEIGGSFEVESAPDRGTCVRFVFPLAETAIP
jgi:signal transduction histidine kinase